MGFYDFTFSDPFTDNALLGIGLFSTVTLTDPVSRATASILLEQQFLDFIDKQGNHTLSNFAPFLATPTFDVMVGTEDIRIGIQPLMITVPSGTMVSGTVEATFTVTPEPSSMAIFGAGLFMLGVTAWARRYRCVGGMHYSTYLNRQ